MTTPITEPPETIPTPAPQQTAPEPEQRGQDDYRGGQPTRPRPPLAPILLGLVLALTAAELASWQFLGRTWTLILNGALVALVLLLVILVRGWRVILAAIFRGARRAGSRVSGGRLGRAGSGGSSRSPGGRAGRLLGAPGSRRRRVLGRLGLGGGAGRAGSGRAGRRAGGAGGAGSSAARSAGSSGRGAGRRSAGSVARKLLGGAARKLGIGRWKTSGPGRGPGSSRGSGARSGRPGSSGRGGGSGSSTSAGGRRRKRNERRKRRSANRAPKSTRDARKKKSGEGVGGFLERTAEAYREGQERYDKSQQEKEKDRNQRSARKAAQNPPETESVYRGSHHGNGSKEMTQPGVGPEDRSLVGYINGLPSLTDAIEAVRTYAGRWASEGTDNQPVDAAVTEGLTTIATLLGHAQSIAQELPGQARVGNEADIHRAENPRKGSGSVEARADYTAAQRDM